MVSNGPNSKIAKAGSQLGRLFGRLIDIELDVDPAFESSFAGLVE